jgi:hypothetical protein
METVPGSGRSVVNVRVRVATTTPWSTILAVIVWEPSVRPVYVRSTLQYRQGSSTVSPASMVSRTVVPVTQSTATHTEAPCTDPSPGWSMTRRLGSAVTVNALQSLASTAPPASRSSAQTVVGPAGCSLTCVDHVPLSMNARPRQDYRLS